MPKSSSLVALRTRKTSLIFAVVGRPDLFPGGPTLTAVTVAAADNAEMLCGYLFDSSVVIDELDHPWGSWLSSNFTGHPSYWGRPWPGVEPELSPQ